MIEAWVCNLLKGLAWEKFSWAIQTVMSLPCHHFMAVGTKAMRSMLMEEFCYEEAKLQKTSMR